ncbi:MAG TPA: acyl-CoA dehydrogenase, partial [Streptosporangiaceae bacterium]|nr:acyl-CoA dehydrogenase [Streptosporangiaceae bacterium]
LMAEYIPPLRDIKFVLEQLADLDGLSKLEAYAHADPGTVLGVIEESGQFIAEVVAPLNQIGDTAGCTLDGDGNVTTAPGFKEAYQQYVEAGWGSVPFPDEFGGGGFPWLVAVVMQEMMASANMVFMLCPLLTQGAIDMLTQHGSPAQQATFVEKMVTGEWAGTMNLTEPQAGSDLGAVRVKAVPAGDGTWRITGQKTFITFGEHDLAGNIIHLVLARVPGAPAGTRGISCFIVPKYLVNDDGSLGDRNDLRCVSIEHKLGIHASPTCVMSYGDAGGAVGYLIGEANQGMRYMFTMMNTARLSVGLQGLSIAERAYQDALRYAQERKQGRAVGAPPGVLSAIVEHPDVRRMLLTMKAYIEAMRALLYTNAISIDLARHHPDRAEREARQELVDLLTPISKAWCTDLGVELASIGLQVHGGMGYVEETGIAQYLRDSRISPIYEGTNGIQAIDLVMRKVPMRDGGVVGDLLAQMEALDPELAAAGPELAGVRPALADGVRVLREATGWILSRSRAEPNDALAGAAPYLRMGGLVVGGWLMARSALAASRLLRDAAGPDAVFLQEKIGTACFYAGQLLPQAAGLLPAVTAGAGPLFQIDLSQASLG